MVEKYKDHPCSICCEEPKENDKITTLPCKHHYHENCVKKWLKMHNSCPICRKKIWSYSVFYMFKNYLYFFKKILKNQ